MSQAPKIKAKKKKQNKTKQNLKLLFFRRNHGVSQPKTLTEALPLFPNASRLSGGEKKKATKPRPGLYQEKKNSNSTLPNFQLHVLALFLK